MEQYKETFPVSDTELVLKMYVLLATLSVQAIAVDIIIRSTIWTIFLVYCKFPIPVLKADHSLSLQYKRMTWK